jgi:hypothetical protein
MTRLITRWRASGESGASFARRHHIPTWTFWYWCRKLAAESRTASVDAPPTFVPVRMVADAEAPAIGHDVGEQAKAKGDDHEVHHDQQGDRQRPGEGHVPPETVPQVDPESWCVGPYTPE